MIIRLVIIGAVLLAGAGLYYGDLNISFWDSVGAINVTGNFNDIANSTLGTLNTGIDDTSTKLGALHGIANSTLGTLNTGIDDTSTTLDNLHNITNSTLGTLHTGIDDTSTKLGDLARGTSMVNENIENKLTHTNSPKSANQNPCDST